MSTDVAIILTTKNRAEFVIRQLKYYKLSKNHHPVYIGDSSNINQKKILLDQLDYFKKFMPIYYYHLPNLNDVKSHIFLTKKVKEKYCAYIGDDDFFIPSSLTKCANFLEKNNDYVTAIGSAAIFKLKNDNMVKGDIAYIGEYWSKKELLEEFSKDRVIEFSKNYKVLQFAVNKKSVYANPMKENTKFSHKQFTELLHCFSSAAHGKSKYLDCLLLIRQGHKNRTSPQSLQSIPRDDWASSYNLFVEHISNIIASKDRLEKSLAKKIVEEAFGNLINITTKHNLITNILKKLLITNYFPLKTIKKFFISIFLFKKDKYLYVKDNKKSKFYEDLKLFYRIIN